MNGKIALPSGRKVRASETGVDIRHQPVRQGTDELFESAAIDRGDLCDVDYRIGVKVGDDIGWHQDVARKRGELNVAREYSYGDGRQLGTVVLVCADDQYRAP